MKTLATLLLLSLVTGCAAFFAIGALAAIPCALVISQIRFSERKQCEREAIQRLRSTRAAYGL